ncbi:hypothetical protein M9Y10_036293 [Tritrichomonas musculus]|uniref:ENTH domain-containing protein n=1 Tax=Tritrichomonas musculus TaxID=1915356 RepID=A0ABR2GWX1_9EUKA
MDFFEKIFSNTNQAPKEDQRLTHSIKRALSGNSSELNPVYLYELNSFCQTTENSNKVMHALSNAIDENCESPMPVFKALKLILLLSKMSSQTFTPAARKYAPEIQTIAHVSFDKPGLPHVNTIHKYANILYLHLVKNVPLPEMKIPPRPKQHSHNQSQIQNQNQSQRPGHTRLDNDGGSLFDSNDTLEDNNNNNNKYEDSGSFLSNLMDLGPKRRPQQQQQQTQQQPSKGFNSQNQEGPRLPAVFASGGAFQGVRSRISQPLDYGYDDENEGESLLNFGNDNNQQINGGNEDLLVGAFDDIDTEQKANKNTTNNNKNSIDQTDFVFSGAEPATSNPPSTDLNAPFNPFGADGFNPTFPDVNDYKDNNDTDKPSINYRRPFVASGPKPKFDPSKMKKKPKVVPNTVPQNNFDPFGTGSASNAFDNFPKEPQKKPSLAERLGKAPQQSQTQEQSAKKPHQPSKNVFDLLGDDVFGDDGVEEPQPTTTESTHQTSQDTHNQSQKGSTNVFDALGDDFGSFENVKTDEKPRVASNEELFQPFGSSPQLSQEIDQTEKSKNSSANVFDVLGDDAFGEPVQNQHDHATSNKELFESLDSSNQNQQEQVPQQKNASANVFDILGDDVFTTPSNSAPITSAQEQPTPSNDDLFEHFDPSAAHKSNTNSNEEPFEPFGKTDSTSQQKVQQTNSKDELFEPFGSSASQQQQQQVDQKPAQKSSGNVFDMLDDNAFSSPAPSTNNSQLQTKGSSAANDLFEPFGNTSAPTSTPALSSSQQKNSSSNVFDMLGDDDFSSPLQAEKAPSQNKLQANSNQDLFEPFDTSVSSQQKQKTNSEEELFEPFGNPASSTSQQKIQQTNSKEELFEPFGKPTSTTSQQKVQQTNSKDELFEPFGSSASQQQQQQVDQKPAQKSSGNVFDMLDDNAFSSPAPSTNNSQLQTKGSSAANDLFEPFGNTSAPTSTPALSSSQQKNSSSNVFDMLDDDMFTSNQAPASQQNQPVASKGSNAANDFFSSYPSVQPSKVPSSELDSLFSSPNQQQQKQPKQLDMFESLGRPPQNQQQNNKPSSANLFDMLDSNDIQSTPAAKSPSKSANVYDIFG